MHSPLINPLGRGNIKMATLDGIPGVEDIVRRCIVNEKRTHLFVSELLNVMYPNTAGLSERSVRRFCLKHGIHGMSRLSDGEIDHYVKESVNKV